MINKETEISKKGKDNACRLFWKRGVTISIDLLTKL